MPIGQEFSRRVGLRAGRTRKSPYACAAAVRSSATGRSASSVGAISATPGTCSMRLSTRHLGQEWCASAGCPSARPGFGPMQAGARLPSANGCLRRRGGLIRRIHRLSTGPVRSKPRRMLCTVRIPGTAGSRTGSRGARAGWQRSVRLTCRSIRRMSVGTLQPCNLRCRSI